MMKLKSLFRRGPAPASSSGSTKQHSNRNKSQSTTSLNSINPPESNEQRRKPATPSIERKPHTSLHRAPVGSEERAVDVGEYEQQAFNKDHHNHHHHHSSQPNSGAHTLPHKTKSSSGKPSKKGQKQPKQLPPTFVAEHHYQQQQQSIGGDPAITTTNNLMTTVALATPPGNQNATGGTGTTATTIIPGNNNHDAHSVPHRGATTVGGTDIANTAAAPPASSIDCNELFRLNSAFVAANFQQEQQLLEANNTMQNLHMKLERSERDKFSLESRILELQPFQNEVGKLNTELCKMQSLHEKEEMEINDLKYENEMLRSRLEGVLNSNKLDQQLHQEQQQQLQENQRLHSSAPASIALSNATEQNVDGSNTPCVTPDWDKQSSSSEISVACLQDKIIQMEETHYSTNEELQATLQELADLQVQITDAQSENERLTEEKNVLFQSLCRQTEKLDEARITIQEHKELVQRDLKQAEVGSSKRENKLLEIIKTSQEEREVILVKREELNTEVQELRQSLETIKQENSRYRERLSLLESTVDAANAERKQFEAELLQAKEEISQRVIENDRLTTLLENARSKIDELEQDLSRGDKTDLSDVLDAARKEKDALEERVAEQQNQLSHNQAEIRRLKDQLSGIIEECKVAKNNAKCALSDLEYRMGQLQKEKDKLSSDYQQLTDSNGELQVQCKCHLEDKTQLQNLLCETQTHLGNAERKLNEKDELLQQEIKVHTQEAEEWQQFQSDLLMTVRVANDFKTEAISAKENLLLDNQKQKEKIRELMTQIEKLKKLEPQLSETEVVPALPIPPSVPALPTVPTVQTVAPPTVLPETVTVRRNKIGSFNRQDSRLSVKTLIESIENNKQSKADDAESNYSSSSSLNSGTPEHTPNILNLPTVENASNVSNGTTSESSTENNQMPVVDSISSPLINSKGPLREQQPPEQTMVSNINLSGFNSTPKSMLSCERKDPLNMLVKNGGSKRNALLKWCQNKTVGYRNIDITNFSSSWNDGLAFCAILHSYLPDRIPYDTLNPTNKRRNFSLAFGAAESVGILTTLNINDMCQLERPDWTQVMTYVTAIYKHFET